MGLEPVKKLPPRKVETVEYSIPLPPPAFIRRTSTAPVAMAPPPLVAPGLVPADLLGLQAQIQAARDATDATDIQDVLAFLEASGL